MAYKIKNEDGQLIDAAFDIDDSKVILHSRGGSLKAGTALNSQYSECLLLLIERLQSLGIPISSVLVVSQNTNHLSQSERTIYEVGADGPLKSKGLKQALQSRMKSVGRKPEAKEKGGNSTRRIEIITAKVDEADLSILLEAENYNRLSSSAFKGITPNHFWRAIKKIRAGFKNHSFGESTGYDLICEDGTRLPPKAVFGIAATEFLDFEVLPEHFSGGKGTTCLKLLEDAGFEIGLKPNKAEEPIPNIVPRDPEDLVWTEGDLKMAQGHYIRERASGLAKAKKEDFRAKHEGQLYCERCDMNPEDQYGKHGEACIEVHHTIPIAELKGEHQTTLDEVECLCANCHRVEHRKIRGVPE